MATEAQEERIRSLEAEVRRLRTMLESAPDFITNITTRGTFLYLNRLAPGFSMEQVLGTSVDGYVPPEVRERAHTAIRAARDTRSVQQYATVGLVAADRVGHYLTRVSPVVEDGEVTSLVMIATDVTDLEDQRILLQVALDATNLGIWTHNAATGAGTWDEATRRILGAPPGDPGPHAQVLDRFVHPEDRELVARGLASAKGTGRYGPLEHRIVRPGGEVRWVSASALTVKNPQGKVVSLVGSLQDITERRTLETRLLEAQKLESIGRLAGGVAHDFNNMLTAILGNVALASEASSLDEVRPLLAEIQLTAERSAALTAQLLAFARRQVIAPRVVNPSTLLQRVGSLLRRVIGEQIRVETTLGAKGFVRVDESQFEQVVMNLVTNARDAMPAGGSLRLETRDVVLDADGAARQPDVAPGSYVALVVADTGAGISPGALPHIFEPFYTTRATGTGLGLATCYGIVKQSGGHIEVTSELGQGTTFRVYLPRVDAALSAVHAARAVATAQANERVLLVEDEPFVRAVAERVLSRHGYRVRSLATAEEAIEVARAEPAFAVLVADVVLPGMGGRDLVRRLAGHCPGLRVLLISGYTQNAIEQGDLNEQGISFLQKPFLPSQLLLAVRKVLDGTEPAVR